MYASGEIYSQFEKGLVIERTPYVRRRYYEGGKAGAGNRKAQPRWFEKTINKHKKDYANQWVTIFNDAKKGKISKSGVKTKGLSFKDIKESFKKGQNIGKKFDNIDKIGENKYTKKIDKITK